MKTFPANTIVIFDRNDVDLGGYEYRLLNMEEVEECGYDSKSYSLIAISPESTKAIEVFSIIPNVASINGEDHAILCQFEFEDEDCDFDPFSEEN